MISEAQIQANRRNCKKSTGPKAIYGKSQSRRNALRHGFRAESGMLTKWMEARVSASIDHWRDVLRPEGQAEDSLVRLAAWSGAQLESLAEQLRKQARKAFERFEDNRIDAVETLIDKVDDPNSALNELGQNTAGCARGGISAERLAKAVAPGENSPEFVDWVREAMAARRASA